MLRQAEYTFLCSKQLQALSPWLSMRQLSTAIRESYSAHILKPLRQMHRLLSAKPSLPACCEPYFRTGKFRKRHKQRRCNCKFKARPNCEESHNGNTDCSYGCVNHIALCTQVYRLKILFISYFNFQKKSAE